MDFFQHHDLYFPRLHRALGVRHVTVAHPLVKRNDQKIFQLSMDVKGFDPKELSLKLDDRELLIKGFEFTPVTETKTNPVSKEDFVRVENCPRM